MLSNQKSAVDRNMVDLIEAVELNATVCCEYLQSRGTISNGEREILERNVTSAGKLRHLFHLLKTKDTGWTQLLSYLKEHNQANLADKLQNDTDRETDENVSKKAKRSALGVFSCRLAQYYKLNYTGVPTMGESPKHVKDVWVPLQIDGRAENHLAADHINHIELLSRLKAAQDRNVALIKGHPGMGKTTLAKKIAYDWAINFGSAAAQLFTLVLSVPLRYAKKSNRFDQLAIDYFLSIIDMEEIDKLQLNSDICQLKSQLLVILDGLDEYGSYSESPFRLMFEAPFQHSSVNCREQLQMTSFKLIITSRPYACERVQVDFPLLRFVILPLDANHLDNLVQLYCETSHGAAKVAEYLKINADLVIKVPLILSFVCFLADSEDAIPTNMTNLYYNLIRQMIRRENRQVKLAEPVDIHKWKEATLVTNTSELAFWEIYRNNFEFTSDSLEKSHVTKDSFICGFLLHKFDFANDILKTEFLHRSIQEFFAALHCYQLMLTGCQDELREIRSLTDTDDSQFGRFLFGICSLEGKFVQMTNWLSPSFGDSVNIWSLAFQISQFGTNLLDCSPGENSLMGKRLQKSIEHLEVKTAHLMVIPYLSSRKPLFLRNLSTEFKEALHLVDLTRNPSGLTHDWYVAESRQSARLAVVSSRLPELLKIEFDLIDIFVFYPSVDQMSRMEWETLLNQTRSLSSARTIIMSTRPLLSADTSVFVRICYVQGTGLALTNFVFEYAREQRKELLEAISDNNLAKLTENKREKQIDFLMRSIVNVNVIVDSCKSQSSLIYSLIRLSLLPPV